MQKLSFLYPQKEVYEISLRVLKHRKYQLLTHDPESGIITGLLDRGKLKPLVNIELQLKQETPELTNLLLHTQAQKHWLNISTDTTILEDQFISSLYHYLNFRHNPRDLQEIS